MRILKRLSALAAGFAATLLTVPCAMAQGVVGAPKGWEMGMQPAFGPLKERAIELHNLVLVIITIITLFVGALLIWVMYRFNSRRNPNPSQNSHNTFLEIAWTVVPVLILVIIAIPSFRLIYFQDRTPDPDMTVKVTGHQWYWSYNYPDQGGFDLDSRYIMDDDLKPGQKRLLDVDNQMIIPVGKKVRILTASTDVIHSFFIPSLGLQRYAIPGRTIETWVEASVPGVFYGQCNQICGENHSRMPIAIKAVPQNEFDTWAQQQKKAADAGKTPKLALQ
ncbi:MAG: cytochrome c oxidase subunit II [Acetobacteraceae bacterium]|nr:cytochrome c oxidase subunit II [Pseudomonadota bacterium]